MSKFRKQYEIKKGGANTPSKGDVHVNTPLTNISIAFLQDQSNFIAGDVFPEVSVSKQSDVYYTFDRGEFNRDEMQERADGTESVGGGYTVSNDPYFARVYALHKDHGEQLVANTDNVLDLDRATTVYLTQKALINREVKWSATYFTAGNPGDTWTFDVDGVASSPTAASSFDPTNASNNDKLQWNDASSTPIEDIRQGKTYVLESTGFEPNTLTLGRHVYNALVDHPDIIGRVDRGQTSGVARAQRDRLAELFEVEQVLVMNANINTAAKGQTASHSFIGGKHALLSYAPPSPGLMTPSAGYHFTWTGLLGMTNNGFRMKKYWLDVISSERLEIESAYVQKKVSADLGYFFGDIVA